MNYQNFDPKIRRNLQKKKKKKSECEHRDYESVDEKRLATQKKKKNSGSKGLTQLCILSLRGISLNITY